jgi:hypothetical protein
MKTCLFVGVFVWFFSATAQDSIGGGLVTLTLNARPQQAAGEHHGPEADMEYV